MADQNTFVAIDFETANYKRNSACSVGLVRVEGGKIVESHVQLIKPPQREFVFTYIHGLTWTDVAGEPTFKECWPKLEEMLKGASFLTAHNASFDKGVLNSCCATYGMDPPELDYVCTMKLARKHWRIFPTKLSDVCKRLDIELNHHEALSDATACAKIVIQALDDGATVL